MGPIYIGLCNCCNFRIADTLEKSINTMLMCFPRTKSTFSHRINKGTGKEVIEKLKHNRYTILIMSNLDLFKAENKLNV